MKKVVCLIGITALVGTLQAEIVAAWDMAGVDVNDGVGITTNAPPYTFMATTGLTQQVKASLGLADGVQPSTSVNQYGFKVQTVDTALSLTEAIAGEHYMEVMLVVSNGYVLNLDSLEMRGQSSASGCSNIAILCSIDGFVAGQEMTSTAPATVAGGFDTDASGFGAPIDLTATRYQQLSGSVAFRIYGWKSKSGSGVTYFRNLSEDDLIINGTVEAVSLEVGPTLSLSVSNDTVSVDAVVEEAASGPFVLQHIPALTDSNGWTTVSGPFSSNAVWTFPATNACGFYRAVAE